jgi:hypothetical protein
MSESHNYKDIFHNIHSTQLPHNSPYNIPCNTPCNSPCNSLCNSSCNNLPYSNIPNNTPCNSPIVSNFVNENNYVIKNNLQKKSARKSILSKRKYSLNNLHIDIDTLKNNDELTNIVNSPMNIINNKESNEELFLNRHKLNSVRHFFAFSSPENTHNDDLNRNCYDETKNNYEDIYISIKEKITKIINEDSNYNKNIMINKIIELFKKINISNYELSSFLNSL